MRETTDTPFGFGSREFLGDDPGSFADEEPGCPTVDLSARGGERIGTPCPHCGEFHEFDVDHPDEIDRHPAVPLDEPVTVVCRDCNGSFYVRID